MVSSFTIYSYPLLFSPTTSEDLSKRSNTRTLSGTLGSTSSQMSKENFGDRSSWITAFDISIQIELNFTEYIFYISRQIQLHLTEYLLKALIYLYSKLIVCLWKECQSRNVSESSAMARTSVMKTFTV